MLHLTLNLEAFSEKPFAMGIWCFVLHVRGRQSFSQPVSYHLQHI